MLPRAGKIGQSQLLPRLPTSRAFQCLVTKGLNLPVFEALRGGYIDNKKNAEHQNRTSNI